MKRLVPCLSLLLFTSVSALQANPEVPAAVAQSFGRATAENILLLKGQGTASEPTEWTAYARDAFRPEDVLRISVKQEGPVWSAAAAGAGSKILDRMPPRAIDFNRLRLRSTEARIAAAQAATLAKTTFVAVDYQLASNAETGAPEWGLALTDADGTEVGYVVVSAETGAVTYQDWSPRTAVVEVEGEEGERAARAVKRAARETWIWTDHARKETREFFRELFR